MKSVTVGIVTRNRSDFLCTCLLSLTKQTVPHFEVIIVNNASTDTTKKVIDFFKTKLPIRYFLEPTKDGMPYGRNKAILKAKGDILAYTDDDCIIPKDWIKKIITAHTLNPHVIAIQGKSVAYKPNLIQKLSDLRYKSWILENIYNRNFLFVVDAKALSLKVKEIKKKKLFYDTNFYRGNDCDFSKLLLINGEKIKYIPSIYVYHRERATLWEAMKQKYSNGKPAGMLRKKWPNYLLVTRYLGIQRERKFLKTLSYFQELLATLYLFLFKASYKISYLQGMHEKYNYLSLAREKIDTSISIVIIVSPKIHSLSAFLHSLQFQTALPKEILIIDTLKVNELKKNIASYKNNFQIRYLSENFSNLEDIKRKAISEAKGKILLFVEKDFKPENTWIEEIYYSYQLAFAAIEENYLFIKKHTILSHYTAWRYKNGIRNESHNNKFSLFIMPPLSVIYMEIGWISLTFDNLLYSYEARRYIAFSKTLAQKHTEAVKTEFAKMFYRTRISLIDFLKHCYNKGRTEAILCSRDRKSNKKILHVNKYSTFYIPKKRLYLYLMFLPFIFIGKKLQWLGFYSELSRLTYVGITGENLSKIDLKDNKNMLSLAVSIVVNTCMSKNSSPIIKPISYIIKLCALQNSKKHNLPYCYFCKGRYFWISPRK